MNMQLTQNRRRMIVATILLALLASMLAGAINAYAGFDITGAKPVGAGTDVGANWNSKHKGIYSAWDAPNPGFRTKAEYGFKPERKKKIAPFTKAESFGKTMAVKKVPDFQDRENTDPADYYAWDIKSNKKGSTGLWMRNLQIYDAKVKKPVIFDMKITFTDWEDETENSPSRHHIVVQHSTEFPRFWLCGMDEIRFKIQYFFAGTSKPYTMTSSLTFADVDATQYVAFDTDQVVHQYLHENTVLSFKKDAGFYAYQDPQKGNGEASDSRHAVGVDFKQHTLEFIYGSVKPSSIPHYFGLGSYRMPRVEPTDPTKTISDSDEKDKRSVLLGNRDEVMTYKVEHRVANGYSPQMYFKNYKMEDTLPDCLQILSVRVQQNSSDASSLFEVQTTGQKVTATAKSSALKESSFYGKTYRLIMEAKLKDGLTDADLAPYMKGEILNITNTGTVTVDDEPLVTNKVIATNWEAAPEKTVSDRDETGVKANTISSRLEGYTYQIKQTIPEDVGSLEKLELSDEIEECMDIQSVNIYEDDVEVSRRWDVTTDGNRVVASDPNPGPHNAGKTYTLEIAVKANWASNTVLDIHQHLNEEKTAAIFQNQGNVCYQITGGEEIDCNTNPVTTTIKLPVDLHIDKTADRYEHQVGDPIHYTVTIGHNTANCDATDVVVQDTDLANFDLDVNNSKVTGVSDYTIKPIDGGWEFATPKLVPGQQVQIEFTAKAKKVLNGTIPENTASVTCYGVPAKYDSEEVYINSPKMKLLKSSERVQYAVGQNIDYTLEVSQINKGCFMRDVLVTDTIQTEGVHILPGSIIVLNKEGKDVTSAMDVTIADNTFTIKTKRNFSDSTQTILPKDRKIAPYSTIDLTSYLKICYTAKIADNGLFDKKVENVAEAPTRPNTNHDPIKDDPAIPSGGTTTKHVASVAGAELRITKDSNKDKYEVGETGIYTIRVEQIRPDYVAKELSIKDDFQIPGMEIDETSIRVRYEREDITDRCAFTYHDKLGYEIHTYQDLAYGETIDITYRANFASEELAGCDIRNVAVASSKTADDKETDHIVAVGQWTAYLNLEKSSDKEEYEVTDTVHYTLKTTNTSPNTAEQVVVSDEMQQKGIEVIPDSIKVYYDSKGNVKDITDACEINAAKDHFDIKTFRNLPRDNAIKVTYDANILDKTLAGKQVKNLAIADAKNTDQVETPHEVSVLPLIHLDLAKNTDRDLYRITDEIAYTVTVLNSDIRAAKNIVLTDCIRTAGIKLLVDTIQVFDPEGKAITEECKIAAEGNQFLIETGQNLQPKERMTVTYRAKIIDPELAGKQVENFATATADNTEDTETEHTVPVEELAVLNIQKESEKKIYNFLDNIIYHLTVTNTAKPTALNVVIEDTIQTEELSILADTVQVIGPDGVDMTQSSKITVEKGSLRIETGKDLKAGEKIHVTYQVKNGIRRLAGKQVDNAAVTKADNSDPSEDKHIVPIESLAKLELKKVSDKGIYHYMEDMMYRLQVRNPSDPVAVNVVIEDTIKTKGLTLLPETIQIKGPDGANITKECMIHTAENSLCIETGKNLSRNEVMEVTYLVKNGNPKLAGQQVDNAAITTSDNSDPEEKEHTVPVEPIAKMTIQKTSDKVQYHLKEDAQYTLEVKTVSDTAARNVVISDTIKTKGLKLVKNSIQVLDSTQKNVTKSCSIDTTDTGFTVNTGRNLSKNQMMTVIYQVHIPDTRPSLVGQDLRNIAITTAENAERADTDHKVPIEKYAELTISKQADKREYKIGESIRYTLKVRTASKLTAKQVVIKDNLKTEGAALVKGSITVLDPKGRNITKDCEIKESKTSFIVKTGKDLENDETMLVTYRVKANKILSGKKLKNVAIVSASNTPERADKQNIQPLASAKMDVKVSPQTGDEMLLWPVITLFALSGLTITGYVIVRRRKGE